LYPPMFAVVVVAERRALSYRICVVEEEHGLWRSNVVSCEDLAPTLFKR